MAMGVDVHLRAQPDLFEMVATLRPPCRLTGRLHGWQKQRHQDADDGDHH